MLIVTTVNKLLFQNNIFIRNKIIKAYNTEEKALVLSHKLYVFFYVKLYRLQKTYKNNLNTPSEYQYITKICFSGNNNNS